MMLINLRQAPINFFFLSIETLKIFSNIELKITFLENSYREGILCNCSSAECYALTEKLFIFL